MIGGIDGLVQSWSKTGSTDKVMAFISKFREKKTLSGIREVMCRSIKNWHLTFGLTMLDFIFVWKLLLQ